MSNENKDKTFDLTRLVDEDKKKPDTNYKANVNYSLKKLAQIVFGGILLYFFFLKFSTVQKATAYIMGVLSPFFIGAAIAFVLKLPMNFFEKKVFDKAPIPFVRKASRLFALLLSIILFIIIVVIMTSMIIPQLITSFTSLQEQVPIFVAYVADVLKRYSLTKNMGIALEDYYSTLSWDAVFEQIKAFFVSGNADIESFSTGAIATAGGIAGSLFSGLTNGALSLVFAIYILLDKERLSQQSKRMAYALAGKEKGQYLIHIADLMNFHFYNFIKGQLLDALIIGAMTFAGMTVLQMPYAAMISLLVGFSDLIPIVGPIIGAAMGFVFILIESPVQALGFLIMMLIFQQIQGNIIYPKIVGDKLGIPPMWSLFATIVGGSLGGVVGMWIFIPLVATIYVVLGDFTTFKLNTLYTKSTEKNASE
ncbi:AI-2E family transporter [Peptoniphilus equinus]|uniref:AI-2E family transporter n=1 Tax=Peptoniphilus equinus TaxID=3016343 RepID=A0ABY7QTR8_9FIRM|nr:AI-2E family transporter [Peptoniphilus equinus]WBW50127.1 AI-2E family transporter [Peptoniphilus equinus]